MNKKIDKTRTWVLKVFPLRDDKGSYVEFTPNHGEKIEIDIPYSSSDKVLYVQESIDGNNKIDTISDKEMDIFEASVVISKGKLRTVKYRGEICHEFTVEVSPIDGTAVIEKMVAPYATNKKYLYLSTMEVED